jgi:ATP-dependent Clp protease adaptor protein ClpS
VCCLFRVLLLLCDLQEAHETGVALVVACAQDQAETYVETLRLNGLISSMEPGH